MYVVDFLNNDELSIVKSLFSELKYKPGEIKSGLNEKVKHCKTADVEHPTYRKLYDYFIDIMPQKRQLNNLYSLKDITVPHAVRYSDGMFYDYHLDEVSMNGVRTDYSMTLFLTDPHEYEGGELVLKQGDIMTPIKLPAGKAILYNTGIVHKVNVVTKGNRDVLLFWAQSIFQDKTMREHCVELARTISFLWETDNPETKKILRELEQSRINLMRQYADL